MGPQRWGGASEVGRGLWGGAGPQGVGLSMVYPLSADVKPSNVLINKEGHVKMCDFGISGYLVDSVAKTMDAGCKPYMAVSALGGPGPWAEPPAAALPCTGPFFCPSGQSLPHCGAAWTCLPCQEQPHPALGGASPGCSWSGQIQPLRLSPGRPGCCVC